MPRRARIVMPGVPHHVTQRGNRRMQTFFELKDYEKYLQILNQSSDDFGTKVLAYCLMPNHIHVIAIPSREESLRKTFSDIHERYTKYINFKKGWQGCLWQGRFFSTPLDSEHLEACYHYVHDNPVRAGLVEKAKDYRWSSVRWVEEEEQVLTAGAEKLLEFYEKIRVCSRTGRPTSAKVGQSYVP